MDAEERQHLEELRQIYQGRLRVLEQRAAQLGFHTPVQDVLEMEGLQAKMADLDRRLTQRLPYAETLATLRRILAKRFGESELRDLCFDLGIDYENLPGQGKADKARELVVYCERRGRTPELIKEVRGLRPNVAWSQAPSSPSIPSQESARPWNAAPFDTLGSHYVAVVPAFFHSFVQTLLARSTVIGFVGLALFLFYLFLAGPTVVIGFFGLALFLLYLFLAGPTVAIDLFGLSLFLFGLGILGIAALPVRRLSYTLPSVVPPPPLSLVLATMLTTGILAVLIGARLARQRPAPALLARGLIIVVVLVALSFGFLL